MKSGLALLLKALAFAARKHRDQRRKDARASPYINHPIALADVLVNEAGVTDVEVLCAALLHDTIEDTEMLRKRTRKRMQIAHAATASRQAKLVKLADRICNLRDIAARPPASWGVERRREYFDWAKSVVDRLRGADPKLEAAFDRAYALRPE